MDSFNRPEKPAKGTLGFFAKAGLMPAEFSWCSASAPVTRRTAIAIEEWKKVLAPRATRPAVGGARLAV